MDKKFGINHWAVFFLIILVVTYLPILMKEEVLDAFVREDRIYESLTAIYFFIASAMFGLAYYRSPIKLNFKDPAWLKRISFLGFASLFLFAALEEISWGQRIFGIETPNLIQDVNVQRELTIHNLNIFQGENAILPLSTDQLSAMFALGFGFVVPVACLLIKPLRKFLTTKFPVLPFQFGWLYPINYFIQKLIIRILPNFPNLYQHTKMKIPQGLYEIREHDYALLLMVSIVFYVLLKLDLSAEERT